MNKPIVIFDPQPPRHDYLSPMYFSPMRSYAEKNGIKINHATPIQTIKDSIVCCLADYLTPEVVSALKNNNCKIVGFSVTDSSYVSQCCREAKDLKNIDLMFMLTGLQRINEGHEMVVTKDFKIELEKRQFLPPDDWEVFNSMRESGRLQSLPYVHAERQPQVQAQPYNQRSQKALIRGGHHMRRFILALKLMSFDKLDINSGFVTSPYFQDDMNPQFRYCDKCRETWKRNKMFPFEKKLFNDGCTNPMWQNGPIDISDLGAWNNRCPQSFYEASLWFYLSQGLNINHVGVEGLLNARWLTQKEHLEMLARITFTSDLKWLFSIYAAQRFWDAASVGCINVLPSRTADQDYFPVMQEWGHYITYDERLDDLNHDFELDEETYNSISRNAKELYDTWMKPSEFTINTNLIKHIFDTIEAYT